MFPRKIGPAPPDQMLTVRITPLRDVETRQSGQETVKLPMLVTIEESEGGHALQTLTGALMGCIDRSSSMGGEKWAAAQAAQIQALQGVTPGSELGVITFNDQAQLLGLMPGGDKAAAACLEQSIRQTHPGGGTQIGQAIRIALSELAQRGGAKAIVLISDGQTQEEAACRQLVEEAARAEVPIHVLGTDDVDIELARFMADRTGGSVEYLSRLGAGDLSRFLSQQLQTTQSVVLQNVRVRLRPAPGVGVSMQAKAYPDIIAFPPSAQEARLGDLPRGDRLQLYAELTIPTPGYDARLRALEADVLYDVPQHGLRDQQASAFLEVTFLAGAAPQQSPEVLRLFQLVKAHQEMEQAAQAPTPDAAVALLVSAERRTRIAGDARKTQVITGLLDNVRRTNVVSDAMRKTAVTAGRRTRVVP